MNRSILLLLCSLFLAANASADKNCLKSTLRNNGKIRNTISTVAAPGACPRGTVEVLDTSTIAPTLAAGKTLRGVWGHFEDPAAPTYQADTVSFGWELATAPTPHYIATGDTVPTGCSGTPEAPGADPGHLCVFERSMVNAASKVIFDPSTGMNNAASTIGFGVYWTSAIGFASLYGSWAVTAPIS